MVVGLRNSSLLACWFFSILCWGDQLLFERLCRIQFCKSNAIEEQFLLSDGGLLCFRGDEDDVMDEATTVSGNCYVDDASTCVVGLQLSKDDYVRLVEALVGHMKKFYQLGLGLPCDKFQSRM